MIKLYSKEKYPCGYEVEEEMVVITLLGIFFGVPEIKNNNNGCPLHGKNCKRLK